MENKQLLEKGGFNFVRMFKCEICGGWEMYYSHPTTEEKRLVSCDGIIQRVEEIPTKRWWEED